MTVDYDALWAESWGDVQDFSPVHLHITRQILRTLRGLPIRSVLDVGCGTGANLEAVQREFGLTDVAGIDISEKALDVARQRVNGQLIVLDLLREKPLDRTFDLVMSSQVIEHVEEDDLFLEKMHAMCGRYCFVGTMQGKMRPSEVSIGHLRNYSRRGLEEKMERAGFAIERVVEWGFPFFSPLYRSAREFVGGDSATVGQKWWHRPVLSFLNQLYRLNSSTHGDVLMILGRRRDAVSQ
jgi:SAM-dependent methyltransferase